MNTLRPLPRAGRDLHAVKCWPEPFQAMWDDDKRHEVRKFDRDYKQGDALVVMEFDPEKQEFTGRQIHGEIGTVTRPGEWGLPEGLGVFTVLVFGRYCDAGHDLFPGGES